MTSCFDHSKLNHCAVIGHGSWATALVKVLADNGNVINWFVNNSEVMESLLMTGRNCRYLTDLEIDLNNVVLSDDINKSVEDASTVFVVTPSAYLKDHLSGLRVSLKDKMIVSAIKGVVPGDNQLVTDYLTNKYGLADGQVAFICGPTHAEEVGREKLTYLTIACHDLDNARAIGEVIRNEYVKIQYTTEVRRLELFSVMKNVYAVMVGIAMGMGCGDNFTSVLVSNCVQEIYRLMDLQSVDDLFGLNPSAFMGDLLASCYSNYSRNRQFGILIGGGKTVESVLGQMTMVAEGYSSSKAIALLPDSLRKKMPIAELTYQVLHKDMRVNNAMEQLKNLLS